MQKEEEGRSGQWGGKGLSVVQEVVWCCPWIMAQESFLFGSLSYL